MKSFKQFYTESQSFQHTVWIDDKGKLIDISKTGLTHHSWVAQHPEYFTDHDPKNPFKTSAQAGWIRIRNISSLTIEGIKSAIKKQAKVIWKFTDDRIMSPEPRAGIISAIDGGFLTDIHHLDSDGSVTKRQTFILPRDENKFKRALK